MEAVPCPAGLVSSHSTPSSGRVPWLHGVSIGQDTGPLEAPGLNFYLLSRKQEEWGNSSLAARSQETSVLGVWEDAVFGSQ